MEDWTIILQGFQCTYKMEGPEDGRVEVLLILPLFQPQSFILFSRMLVDFRVIESLTVYIYQFLLLDISLKDGLVTLWRVEM